jgi:hypothetical protein
MKIPLVDSVCVLLLSFIISVLRFAYAFTPCLSVGTSPSQFVQSQICRFQIPSVP